MALLNEPAPLAQTDHHHILTLFRRARHRHMHIDWRTLDQWLENPMLWARVLREGDAVTTMIGATVHKHPLHPDADPVAWLRFMAPGNGPRDPGFRVLWNALRADLKNRGVTEVACLIMHPWTQRAITDWGFEHINAIVTLRRIGGEIPDDHLPDDTQLRTGTLADLDAVTRVDAAAFEPLWAYGRATIRLAIEEAASFTVLETASELVGYQITTDHYSSAHLARLAVMPGLQGRGYGRVLVSDMLRSFKERRITLVTVNTQEDNLRSRRLYSHLSFQRAGYDVPVYSLRI
ncbi:MAG: GNAT family N-acetyltransferase [Anaerolineae bacterium]